MLSKSPMFGREISPQQSVQAIFHSWSSVNAILKSWYQLLSMYARYNWSNIKINSFYWKEIHSGWTCGSYVLAAVIRSVYRCNLQPYMLFSKTFEFCFRSVLGLKIEELENLSNTMMIWYNEVKTAAFGLHDMHLYTIDCTEKYIGTIELVCLSC